MRKKKRLTPAEFRAVRQLLNISYNRIEAARQVLVEGKTFQSVGDQFGWTRQAVFDTVGVVWKTYERYLKAKRVANPLNPETHLVSRKSRMRTKKPLTEAEFNAVRHLLNISEDRIEAARQVLVEGRTFQSVGDQFGWTWQSVFDAVDVVWKTYERYLKALRAEADATAKTSKPRLED